LKIKGYSKKFVEVQEEVAKRKLSFLSQNIESYEEKKYYIFLTPEPIK